MLRGAIVPALLVAGATLLAYLPAFSGEFIWNDSDYVTAAPMRSLHGLARIWVDVGSTQQYYPLLHSFFWVQHRLWGDHPFGYHVLALLLHAAAAVLFAVVLRRLLGGYRRNSSEAAPYPGAEWLAALLFALHPVHVESVAWISEQKNTLSLVFYLSSALAYLHFYDTRRARVYGAALALFVVSLLCKTVTTTLPAALLVALWWRRGRLGWRRDILPLVPWFVIGAGAGMFSGWVERSFGGARGPEFDIPFLSRVLVAGRAVWFYAANLAWPVRLDFIYPRWAVNPANGWEWLFPIGVLAAALALYSIRRRTRGPLAAFLFFVGSLFPVLGFVNLYGARYSWVWDHWQYLPDLGPIALVAVGFVAAWGRVPAHFRRLGPWLVAAVAALLAGITWAHCGMFHDNLTLYRENIALNPGSWLAHNNLGYELGKTPAGLNDALAEYNEALRLNPNAYEAHNNLGIMLEAMPGRSGDAIAQYEEAIRLRPDFPEAHYNLGNALANEGRREEAVAHFQEAFRLKVYYPEAHYNLANTLEALGRTPEAIVQFEEALRARPNYAEAHNNLGLALLKTPGRADDAVAEFEETIRLKPEIAEAHDNLGKAWSVVPGKAAAALDQFEEALRLDPGLSDAHYYLANALVQSGRIPEAIHHYEEALRIQPNLAEASSNLGMVLCRTGNLSAGLERIEAAIRMKPDFVPAHFARGAALLQLGRKNEAQGEFEQVLRLRPGDPSARRMLELLASGQ